MENNIFLGRQDSKISRYTNSMISIYNPYFWTNDTGMEWNKQTDTPYIEV
jgi:hypothetical protein